MLEQNDQTPAGTAELEKWLVEQTGKSTLRFLTCGSVDDGKSTLIGRLLYDSQLVLDDQLATLRKESRNRTTGEEGLDFSLLVDGLSAEREQGITIDVAYRFFSTDKRKFIVADTPGHEQYTRNMATGASNAELGVVLVDARKGIIQQTRRHSFILALIGVRHVVLAVNKMDIEGYRQDLFEQIEADFTDFAEPLGFETVQAIPLSALKGDNILTPSAQMSWYDGPQLVPYLEQIDVGTDRTLSSPRFSVQWVNRASRDFRGFSGTMTAGKLCVGDEVLVASSRKSAKIARIVTMDGDLSVVGPGQAVTLVLDREIDISRGDVLARPGELPEFSDQFQARLVWMNEQAALPGRSYLLKLAAQSVPVTLTGLKHRTDINTLEKLAAQTLNLNDVGTVTLKTDRPVAFDTYGANAEMGGFILIDRLTNQTMAAGVIDFGLRRGHNLSFQNFEINREVRARQKNQEPHIIWFTGLSGSGKSTIANLVEKRLTAEGRHVYILDGDNVRHGLNQDLGFTDADRVENIRRVAEVARLMADAGLIVIVSFISPFRNERRMARELAGDIRFTEVFMDTPLEICARRDPKGLYAKARAGDLKNFTGIDSPFERPEEADVVLDGSVDDAQTLALELHAALFGA